MRRTLGVVVVSALVLAGCQPGGDDAAEPTDAPTSTGETTGPSPSAPTSGTTTPPATATAPDVPWTEDLTQQDTVDRGVPQEITGVRTGVHDGFDRIVLDLTGDERVLGWGADYVDEAVHDPSGFPLEVEGTAYLQVAVRGIDWIADADERYSGDTVQGQGTEVVTAVAFGGLFEGQQQIVIGLREKAPYRIFGLDDPARLVIDVQHP